MNVNHEVEYKTMIDQTSFNQLIASFDTVKVEQVNSYFDTIDHELLTTKIIIRIRKNNNSCLWTMKVTDHTGVIEYEEPVIGGTIEAFDNTNIKSILNHYQIDINNLILIGQLKTIRYLHKTKDYELCFDDNYYLAEHDYELEYEVKSDHLDHFANFISILNRFNIKYQPSIPKALRLFHHQKATSS